jgi:hypothetical protein
MPLTKTDYGEHRLPALAASPKSMEKPFMWSLSAPSILLKKEHVNLSSVNYLHKKETNNNINPRGAMCIMSTISICILLYDLYI